MATPFTNFFHLTQASSGATRNSGTNGDLAALLKWAAVDTSNWAQEFTATNAKVLRPASGRRNRLCINHDSAVSGDARLAVVRGAESASSTTSFTDPFPTVAQVVDASCNWWPSNTASTTTRDFHIWVWETGLIYATRFSGTTDVWEIHFFGDAWVRFGAADATYNTVIVVRNSVSVTVAQVMASGTNATPTTAQAKFFAMRDISGVLKSEQLYPDGRGATIGIVTGLPAIRSGYSNYVDRSKFCIHANGSTTTTVGSVPVAARFCFPQLWTPLHNGLAGVSETDVLTDAVYDASANFILIKNGSNAFIVENTNTSTGYPAG